MIGVMPDGRLWLFDAKVGDPADAAAVRAEIDKTALRNQELDELIAGIQPRRTGATIQGGRMPYEYGTPLDVLLIK